jgi:hypothetical protein
MLGARTYADHFNGGLNTKSYWEPHFHNHDRKYHWETRCSSSRSKLDHPHTQVLASQHAMEMSCSIAHGTFGADRSSRSLPLDANHLGRRSSSLLPGVNRPGQKSRRLPPDANHPARNLGSVVLWLVGVSQKFLPRPTLCQCPFASMATTSSLRTAFRT